MIKFSRGKIRLEDRIVDLSRFEIRPKVTESDLEGHYDSFIEHAEEIGDYFEDRTSFDKALRDASGDKRPKLIPREPVYPPFWKIATINPFSSYLNPKEEFKDDYFIGGLCAVAIPRKGVEVSNGKTLNERPEAIAKRFERFPGYEGIIEISNDGTPLEAKATTFHEALHYLILKYQVETDRSFVKAFVKKEISELERYQSERIIHERVVEILTDKLLTHDPDAQFEGRWLHYSFNQGFPHLVKAASTITIGILLGVSISNPYLLPLTIVPGRVSDFALEKYKQSKREEILQPTEYPNLKI